MSINVICKVSMSAALRVASFTVDIQKKSNGGQKAHEREDWLCPSPLGKIYLSWLQWSHFPPSIFFLQNLCFPPVCIRQVLLVIRENLACCKCCHLMHSGQKNWWKKESDKSYINSSISQNINNFALKSYIPLRWGKLFSWEQSLTWSSLGDGTV